MNAAQRRMRFGRQSLRRPRGVTVVNVASDECDVLVIGAGVSGLTTAVCLAEAGLRAVIRAEQPPERTTSVAAGALWSPHLVEQGDRVQVWGRQTFAEFERLAEDAATGVRMASGVQAAKVTAELPDWAGSVPGLRACRGGELPADYLAGWRLTVPLVEMPVYLGYLARRFATAGGKVELAGVGSLAEAAAGARAVANCAGIGARHLVPDPLVTPVRGQAVIVRNPGITEFFVDIGEDTREGSSDLLYFFPHPAIVVLGGTQEHGSWELSPDPHTAQRIVDRCAAVAPRLRNAEVIAHRVGLRPVRPKIRLEAERLPSGTLVGHNYGHGGAGITMSWGCARDLTRMMANELS